MNDLKTCMGDNLDQHTLGHGDYDPFATAILSQNHREIDITESILAIRKVIIEGIFPIMMSSAIWP